MEMCRRVLSNNTHSNLHSHRCATLAKRAYQDSQDQGGPGPHVDLDEVDHLQGVTINGINNFYLLNFYKKSVQGPPDGPDGQDWPGTGPHVDLDEVEHLQGCHHRQY